ncbi:hypothetical protein [Kutzneria sp. NPDC051319]|uniref:hypothetical protein n=1 Tax=Kutzneria sp. NPDC051319 TaxID=3155047 RepID=UPI0034342B34
MGFFTVSSKAPTMRAKARQSVANAGNRAVAATGGAVCIVCDKAIAGAKPGKANVHAGSCTRKLAAGWKSIHEA